jgi:hypothetical protein
MMGTFIPKGSMLLANIKYESSSRLGRRHLTLFPLRFMLRDERFWDDPAEFKPERFLQELKEGQVDPKSLIFGFGRRLATGLLRSRGLVLIQGTRICPGRDMANQIAPAFIMTLLWAFEIIPIEGEARPDPRNPQFVDSVIAYVHLYSFQKLAYSFHFKLQRPRPLSVANSDRVPKRLFDLYARRRSMNEKKIVLITYSQKYRVVKVPFFSIKRYKGVD